MRHTTTTVTLQQKPYLIDDVSLEETDVFIKRNFSVQKKGMSLSHGFSWSSLRSYRFDRVIARVEILQRGPLSPTLPGPVSIVISCSFQDASVVFILAVIMLCSFYGTSKQFNDVIHSVLATLQGKHCSEPSFTGEENESGGCSRNLSTDSAGGRFQAPVSAAQSSCF